MNSGWMDDLLIQSHAGAVMLESGGGGGGGVGGGGLDSLAAPTPISTEVR